MSRDSAPTRSLQEALDAIQVALNAGNVELASELAEAGLAAGHNHPQLLNLAAYRLELQGRYEEALDLLHRALDLSPRDAFVLNSIGVCFTKVGAPDEALRAFDSALSLEPNLPASHHGRGLAFAALGNRAGASRAYQEAVRLAPQFAEPWGALAAMAVEENEPAAARELAARALALDPMQAAATLTLATLETREGAHEAALSRLNALLAHANLAPLHRASALRLVADAQDELDRPAEAMDAYMAANRQLRDLYALDDETGRAELGLERARRILAYFKGADPVRWRTSPPTSLAGAGERAHVFLVGFPRSGTTLLEQVLASHSSVVALEEQPTLEQSVGEFFKDTPSLDRLSELSASEADVHREAYWRRVREFGIDPSQRVFVDKLPLNTLYLPLIAKLFPSAKVILAIRDPRDVVVSCFRRRFTANALVVEFTDLVRTAQFYDAVMQVAAAYRHLLALPVHEYRYEGLVDDFDREAGALCAFLGVPWDPAMRDFADTAQRRDIRTPSAGQVRRGLYQEGIGQWRRYGEVIAPIQPVLEPWLKTFGYPLA